MLPQNEANPWENNAEARSQQSHFATLLKSHLHIDTPRKLAAHLQNTLVWENTLGGLLLHVKRILKDLNYKTFLFTVLKRNLLMLKMDK